MAGSGSPSLALTVRGDMVSCAVLTCLTAATGMVCWQMASSMVARGPRLMVREEVGGGVAGLRRPSCKYRDYSQFWAHSSHIH